MNPRENSKGANMEIDKFIINRKNSILVIIDVQQRYLPHLEESEIMLKNIGILMQASKKLSIPTIITEQYPQGLGHTDTELSRLNPIKPVEKISFSSCGEDNFNSEIKKTNRSHVILTGIETHVCVLQTALDLIKNGYCVHLVEDAVRSRQELKRKIGTELMRQAGVVITCTETIIFQWLEKSGTSEFKEIQKLVK